MDGHSIGITRRLALPAALLLLLHVIVPRVVASPASDSGFQCTELTSNCDLLVNRGQTNHRLQGLLAMDGYVFSHFREPLAVHSLTRCEQHDPQQEVPSPPNCIIFQYFFGVSPDNSTGFAPMVQLEPGSGEFIATVGSAMVCRIGRAIHTIIGIHAYIIQECGFKSLCCSFLVCRGIALLALLTRAQP